MRRMEQAQGLKLMKFEEVYARTTARLLSQAEAAEVLGASERTFRRWRGRCEADGAEGLYDRRLSRVSVRRAPLDEVARALALFDTCCWDFTAKHFREKLVALHGCKRSDNWVRLTLAGAWAHARGAHARCAPAQASAPRDPPALVSIRRGCGRCWAGHRATTTWASSCARRWRGRERGPVRSRVKASRDRAARRRWPRRAGLKR